VAREYGQFCGLARALELVGARWSLLIVRELLTGPKRFTELEHGLPGIPTNVLSSRLRELEDAGLVQRSLQAERSSSVVYGLTEYGLELEEPVVHLGLWGSKALGRPEEDDFFSVGALAIALRGAFHPERAKGRDALCEIRFDGSSLHVVVSDGRVSFPNESPTDPHLLLEMPAATFAELLAGSLDVDAAVASGRARVQGSRREARRIFEIFRLPSRSAAEQTGVANR
jgi:DNA-binding HxlR family transcriptional regulator/putative sterol carrier protein